MNHTLNMFRTDIISGLKAPRKKIQSKWFYDAEGSKIFETICGLPEYYITRQEIKLYESIIDELSSYIINDATLIELGSGASLKTRILLESCKNIKVYKPVEISQSALNNAVDIIKKFYPSLKVHPVLGDFTQLGSLHDVNSALTTQKICFFPGTTIGNFPPQEAINLMSSVRDYLQGSSENYFIVGVDLAKDRSTLEAAYNDNQGVTAAFNLNILTRINKELNGTFDLNKFAHRVQYNQLEGRMEMHIESLENQDIQVASESIHFYAGETIHTECSYKHTIDGFTALSIRAGWNIVKVWISPEPSVSVFLLSPK